MMPTKGSPLFESAYFILRRETEERVPSQNEMLSEATRILEENALPQKKRPLRRRHLALAFAIGFALGALTVGAFWLTAL